MRHISYSQYRSYTSCPRSWYLSRLKGGEEKQSWYIPIGSAVHSMIEDYLEDPHQRILTEDYMYPLVEKQMQVEPDLSQWLAGGPEAAPVTHEKALLRARECFEKAVEELEAIEVWEVEYDATGSLPGLSVPVKAFVDIVGEHKKKKIPVIWDWKTGSTKPDNFQLQTYRALIDYNRLDLNWGGLPLEGRYIMLSPTYTSTTRYVDLSKVDPEEVGRKYQKVFEAMNAKKYQTNAGFGCRFCFQSANCLVNSGPTKRALHYDKSSEDGMPF